MPDTIEDIQSCSSNLKDALDSLTEGVAGDAKDVVRQLLAKYSVIIPEIDERLAKCDALLQRGLRDEALSYANDAPSLFDAVGFLDLEKNQQQWEKWKATLALHEMSIPVGPKVDIARELYDAEMYLAQLKPLLSKYRRAVLENAPLVQRLGLLRKLREADPTCSAWIESIQEHEKRRLMDMEVEVQDAFQQKNETALQRIAKELQAKWIKRPPAHLVASVKKSLKKVTDNRVGIQLDTITHALVMAKAEGDLGSARALREQWSALETENGSFSVDDPNVTKVLPVLEWVQQHDDIERLYLDLESEIDQQPVSRKERLAWVNSLKQSCLKIDGLATDLEAEIDRADTDRLIAHVNEVVMKHDTDEIHRQRWMYFTMVAVCITVVIATWLFLSARQFAGTVELVLRDLQDVLQRVETGEETTRPVLEETVPASVLDDERVTTFFREVDRAFDIEEDRRQQLADADERFDAALKSVQGPADGISAWPDGFEEAVEVLVHSIPAFSKTVDEKNIINKKKERLEEKMQLFQDKADSFCGQKTRELNTQIDRALADIRERPKTAAEAAAAVRAELEQLEKEATQVAMPSAAGEYAQWRMVSEEGQKLFTPGANSIKQNLEFLEKRVQQIRGITMADANIDAALGNWIKYGQLLNATANDFKDDAKEYAEAAQLEGFWVAIDQWNQLAKESSAIGTLDSDRAEKLVKKITALSEMSESRFSDLQCVKDFVGQDKALLEAFAARKPTELLVKLKEWYAREWMTEIGFTATIEGEVFYCLKSPPKDSADIDVITGLKIDAFGWPQASEYVRKSDWAVERSPQAALADDLQQNEWTKLPNDISGLKGDQFIINCIQRVLSAEEVDPCLRLVNVRKFFLIGRGDDTFRSFCFDIPEAHEFYTRINGPGGIPNISIDELGRAFTPSKVRNADGVYKAVRKRAEEILDQAQKTLQAIREKLKQITLRCSRGQQEFVLVGRLALDDRGRKILTAQKQGVEASRIVAVDSTGAFVLIGEFVGAVPLLKNQVAFPAGTPCFVEVPVDAPSEK